MAGRVALQRLEEALHNIDDCRVSTIHGFCSKLLAEYAFESSMAFQVKLEKNVQSITEKLIKDFCRSTRYSAVDLPGWEELDPGNLAQTVNDLMGRHSARLQLMRKPFESKEAIYNRLHELQQEFIDLMVVNDWW